MVAQDSEPIDRAIEKMPFEKDDPAAYGVDEIIAKRDLEFLIRSKCTGTLYLMHGRNPRHESNYANCADFPWFKNLTVNKTDLFNSLLRLRTIKTPEEL